MIVTTIVALAVARALLADGSATGPAAPLASLTVAAPPPPVGKGFIDAYCIDCHDGESRKGGLDLSSLKFDPHDPASFAQWVKIHDRVRDHEMPPQKKKQPGQDDARSFLKAIAEPLIAVDRANERLEGRSTLRRLNRYEYENTLRDLLDAPWLQVKDMLPEDGEMDRFNKVGDAMDVSHVQMSRYLQAADYALREVIAPRVQKPASTVVRYYARQCGAFTGKMKFTQFNRSPERSTFALLGSQAQPEVMLEKAPITVGDKDPQTRDREAMGVVASSYEPLELQFDKFRAPRSGRYILRLAGYTFWAAPGQGPRWWIPDRNKTFPGRRDEPVTLYADTPPRLLRRLGAFDFGIEPSVQEIETDLLAGETVQPDAARLFRSRPPAWHNPLAEKDGQPGVAFQWLEVEGPILNQWPSAGHELLFGDLPIKDLPAGGVDVVTADPAGDADRLLRNFLKRAYRRPIDEADVARFMAVIRLAMDTGSSFKEAMIAGYSSVLCSPAFVYLEERPGKLDDYALAERLSYFLWNSAPDEPLRKLAEAGKLHERQVLDAQVDRLLSDPRSGRFVTAFLDYWLDLRKIDNVSADETLYNDYYLDDLLTESALSETRAFFTQLLASDLPSSNIVSSRFVMVNERLADLYDLPPVKGVKVRRVELPPDSVRGGLLTQASVLKLTANGTTTSPVLRGAWIMERVLGKKPPPPPPSVPAIEPDTRGATTIRQQLEKHRTQASCSACHAKIDPAGFALESFDVCGGYRERYRALGDSEPEKGFGKNGQPYTFHEGPEVDSSGQLPDGRKFADVRELKALLLADPRQLARNLARQLLVYATGASVRFGDGPQVEQILDSAENTNYGVRSLIHAIVQSDLFQSK